MTSGRIHRLSYIECDGKGCHETIEGSDFTELWNDAKADGWKGRQFHGEWFHYCPSCEPPAADMKKLTGGL